MPYVPAPVIEKLATRGKMEVIPKLFANKFRQHQRYAIFKLFGLLVATMICSTIAQEASKFLAEVIFFAGSSVTLIFLLGFAAAKHYENSEIVNTTNPILLQIYASNFYVKLQNVWQPISRVLFVSFFHVFLLFALFVLLFPFFAKVYGS